MTSSERGASLFEVMASLLLLSITASGAALTAPSLLSSLNQGNARETVESALRRAKGESAAAGSRGVLLADNTGSTLSFGLDVLPVNSPPSPDTVLFHLSLPRGITLSTSPVIFDPRGFVVNESNFLTSQTITLFENGAPFGRSEVFPTGAVRFTPEAHVR